MSYVAGAVRAVRAVRAVLDTSGSSVEIPSNLEFTLKFCATSSPDITGHDWSRLVTNGQGQQRGKTGGTFGDLSGESGIRGASESQRQILTHKHSFVSTARCLLKILTRFTQYDLAG